MLFTHGARQTERGGALYVVGGSSATFSDHVTLHSNEAVRHLGLLEINIDETWADISVHDKMAADVYRMLFECV